MSGIPPAVKAKLDWAAKHAQATSDEITAFYKRKPYSFLLEVDFEEREHRFKMRSMEEPIPDAIAFCVGDCVHNLRASLDHLAWQLALLVSAAPPKRTEFPIFKDEAPYLGARNGKIGGLPEAAQTIIDSVQPYHRGDAAERNPLWIVHQLDIDDKHKLPSLVAVAADSGGTFMPVGGSIEINPGPLEDDAVVMTVRFPEGVDLEVDVEPKLTFQVAFGKASPASGGHVVASLVELGKAVEATAARFAPFF